MDVRPSFAYPAVSYSNPEAMHLDGRSLFTPMTAV
jgi:hypothetical protein